MFHEWEMPFGKYRGEPLSEIPTGYLRWVLDTCELRSEDLRDAIEEELESREASRREAPPRSESGSRNTGTAPPPPSIAKEELRKILRDWYRSLAARFHHDRGNDQNIMRALNVARDELLRNLGLD